MQKNGNKTQILIADDHNIVRHGLRMILENEDDLEVVSETDNGLDAINIAKTIKPDIFIIDLFMPKMNGIETTQHILNKNPKALILILSMCAEKQMIIEALSAGAKGYLLKDCISTDLVLAIRNIFSGGIHLSQKIAGLLVEEFIYPKSNLQTGNQYKISPRQMEILRLIANGKNTKEIAFLLKVSSKTVETHRNNLMKGLNLKTIADLVKYAIREHIITINRHYF